MAGPSWIRTNDEGVKVPCLTPWLWAYVFIWGGRWESNPPMSGPQPDALTASPRPPNLSAISIIHDFHLM